MTTFCSEYDLDFSNVTGISAYVACGYNTGTKKLLMMKVTELPAGIGALIVGTSGTCQIPVNATSLFYQNLLKPVDENMNVPNSECDYSCYSNYVLTNGAFSRAVETPISAYQAYLRLPQYMVANVGTVSIEFVDMGDMNNDKKVTITDAIMILDQILTNQ